ncbi:uncharacterized protein LOC113474615 isoform X1 [Ciona intestinalis]
MDSDNNDRKPEWAKWSNAGLKNEADDEEVGWYSPYEMYVDLDEETKEVSEKFKTTWGRWEKQKAEGDGKNKNVVPEGPYDMYVDLDEVNILFCNIYQISSFFNTCFYYRERKTFQRSLKRGGNSGKRQRLR